MRSVAGRRRKARAAIPDGFAFDAGLRRGLVGKTLRRISSAFDVVGSRIRRLDGTAWALGLLAASIGYGMALGGQYKDFLNETTTALGFGVQQIEIRGLAESDSTEIVDRIDVTRHTSLLMVNAEKARERIAEIPWVRDVSVRKLYPGQIQVTLTERKAYALWQDDGRIKVVDKAGAIMSDEIGPRHVSLPLVVGQGANLRLDEAIGLLNAAPSLRPKLRAAVLVAERRWNLISTDNVEIRLPEEGAREALAQLARVQADKRLLDRDIVAIDMRAPDRFFVKLSDAAAAARREAIKLRLAKKKGETT